MSGSRWRVGVVVPARDEEDRIGACLRSVTAALAVAGRPYALCVVADRCTDATAARAAALGADVLVNERDGCIGEIRNRGVARVLDRLGADRPSATALPEGAAPEAPRSRCRDVWLLHTDADTVVGPAWVTGHLRHADAGALAVAGAVDLDDPHALPADVLARYSALVAGTTGHAYAANLGVRADAFLAVGGFPGVRHGEEHALLHRLRAADARVVTADEVRARTSARLAGRAHGGLADLLRDLAGGGVAATRPG